MMVSIGDDMGGNVELKETMVGLEPKPWDYLRLFDTPFFHFFAPVFSLSKDSKHRKAINNAYQICEMISYIKGLKAAFLFLP